MFSQFYAYDDDNAELEARIGRNRNLKKEILLCLQTMLREVNSYMKSYKTARERLSDNSAESFHIA